MTWFASLFDAWGAGSFPLSTFPWVDYLKVMWSALTLYLPLVAVTGVALWAVYLLFPRGES